MHAGADSIFADRRLVITIVTFAIILPLCFPRELGALAWVSMAAVSLALLSGCLSAHGALLLGAGHSCAEQHGTGCSAPSRAPVTL